MKLCGIPSIYMVGALSGLIKIMASIFFALVVFNNQQHLRGQIRLFSRFFGFLRTGCVAAARGAPGRAASRVVNSRV